MNLHKREQKSDKWKHKIDISGNKRDISGNKPPRKAPPQRLFCALYSLYRRKLPLRSVFLRARASCKREATHSFLQENTVGIGRVFEWQIEANMPIKKLAKIKYKKDKQWQRK